MTTFGRPSWLDRAVDEALAVCPTMGNVVGFRCGHCAAMWTLGLVDSGIPR